MLTVLGIIALVLLLVVLLWAYCHFLTEGGFLGFWLAFNLADTIGQIAVLLWACIASMFSRD